jgi:RNA polymerase sigma-70 factor (ECF subfamily)
VEIQAIAQVILRDRDEAADVLEETVITAWERASHLRDPAELRPWLLRIATGLALGRRRRNARLVSLVAETEVTASPATEASAIAAETRLVILEGLALLAPRERAVIALTCLADLPLEEIAATMGVRSRAAGELLGQALAKLECSLVDDIGSRPEIVELRRV